MLRIVVSIEFNDSRSFFGENDFGFPCEEIKEVGVVDLKFYLSFLSDAEASDSPGVMTATSDLGKL